MNNELKEEEKSKTSRRKYVRGRTGEGERLKDDVRVKGEKKKIEQENKGG